MKTRMPKFLAVVVVLIMSASVLVACGSTPEPTVTEKAVEQETAPTVAVEPSKHGGTLTIALAEQPSTLNAYGGMSDDKTLRHIIETLVDFDKQTLEPVPMLATSWEIPDETTYVFTLREGVKFHDGTDFDAEAVKSAFEYILDPDNASPAASYFDRVESVEVTDQYKVTFRLSEPFAVFLSNLGDRGYIMSPTFVQSATLDQMDSKPVGTGPFQIVQWVKDDQIVLTRFEDYWDDDLPYLDKLVYKLIPDHTAKMVALKAGEIDMVDNVPAPEVEAIKADQRFVFASAPSTGYRSLYLNCEAPPFDDVRLRQALAWAVDRDEVIALGTLGIGTPAFGPIAPPQWPFDPDFKPYWQDFDKAKELMAEAGYPDGFSFTIKVANSPEEIRMAEVLEQQFAQAGIKMDMVIGEYTALRSTVIEGDYQAFFVGWLGGPDPDANVWNGFHSNGWFNWVNYSNPQVDQLLDEARSISDIAKRTELYREAQQIISDQAPMVFLRYPYFAADGQAHGKRVKNFVPDPEQVMYFHQVWLDPK